ncbi:MAG: insulinase family protein [Acidimicrobiia bacterium]|nr:insulinase family protein [Acidimicrobiia bacterium]
MNIGGDGRAARSSVDRSRLPTPGPARPFKCPVIEKAVLGNGLRVWTVRHPAIPVTSLMLLVTRGAAADPRGREGLAALTLDMLDEGSGDRSAIQMHEALAAIGAQLDSDIGSDALLLGTTVLSRFTERALQLLADMLVRPAMREADFVRVRQLRLHRLAQLRDMPAALADRMFTSLLYGSHPYGHTPLGSETALADTSCDDVRAFHAAAIRPSDTTLIAVGDCDLDVTVRLAERVLADWSGSSSPSPTFGDELPRPARLNIIPRPGAPQSELRIGHVAVPRRTPDYYALVAANMILGGQFVSRINLNLREDKGFTYGARTSFDFRREPGPFTLQVSVHTASTARAIQESMAEISDVRGQRPVAADELAMGVAALTRGYPRSFETAEQIARAVTQLVVHELPDDYFAEFVPAVERVTPADVMEAATRHLHPDRLTTLIVGDLDAIGASLSDLGLGEPVVFAASA